MSAERFTIAHVSDLHVLSPRGVEWRSIVFNKRITGYANLVLSRGRVYRRPFLDAVLAAAARADHVVITGDITNLSLEAEFDGARHLLADLARSVEVTVVPGNHDVYLATVHRAGRFSHHFEAYLRSDVPELAVALPVGRFPFVKLRGPVAIVGLSSAVPRPPFVSSGRIGDAQLEALARILAHPEVASRTPVVLVHHPPFDARLRLAQLRGGLVDAAALRRTLAPVRQGLLLYGHRHERAHRRLETAAGAIDAVCATAAALDHPSPACRAGVNLYELDGAGGIARLEAQVVGNDGVALRPAAIPGPREVA